MMQTAVSRSTDAWRAWFACSLLWALRMAAWMGLAALGFAATAETSRALVPVALWLCGLGIGAALLRRFPLRAGARRVLMMAVASVAAVALWPAGARGAALAVVALALAAMVVLAAATARACRLPGTRGAAGPFAAAAVGAALAWLVVGDIERAADLAQRLGAGAVAAALLLSLLHPARAGAHATDGRHGQAHPLLQVASWVMLPMMCGLPLMVALCRAGAWPPRAMLALHLAAMFLPACLLSLRRLALPRHMRLQACAVLLGIGALSAFWAVWSAAGWIALALSHGMAWSVAWSLRCEEVGKSSAAPRPPLWMAIAHGLGALGLGLAIAAAGPLALAATHAVLGIAGVGCLLAMPPRCARRRSAFA